MPRRSPNNEGSVYQRSSDGLWCAVVTLPSGKRSTPKYGKTEREAKRKLREMLAEVEAGRPVPLGRTPTLGQYLTRWLDVRVAGEVEAGHLEPSTADSYRQMVEGHVLPTFLAGLKLNALSADDIRAWQRERLKTTSARGRTYSPRTVGMAHAALRRALNDAMRDEVIGRNVATLVRLPAGQAKRTDPPSEADLARVLAEMLTDRHRALWFTMLAFGPRRGEALAMRWSLVDLDEATVKLRKQIRRERGEVDPATGHRKGKLVEKDLKTAESQATLSMPSALVEVLQIHRRDQVRERLAARVWLDPDLVFATGVGTAYEPRNINRAWTAVCKRAGVKGVRLHDLRHAAASMAFAAGASIKEVQSMLRHTRQATTADLYVHVYEEVRQGTASRMDSVLRKLGGA